MERHGDVGSTHVLKNVKEVDFARNFARYVQNLQLIAISRWCHMVHLEAYMCMTYYKKICIPRTSFCIFFSINSWMDIVFLGVSYSFSLGCGFVLAANNFQYTSKIRTIFSDDINDFNTLWQTLYDGFVRPFPRTSSIEYLHINQVDMFMYVFAIVVFVFVFICGKLVGTIRNNAIEKYDLKAKIMAQHDNYNNNGSMILLHCKIVEVWNDYF